MQMCLIRQRLNMQHINMKYSVQLPALNSPLIYSCYILHTRRLSCSVLHFYRPQSERSSGNAGSYSPDPPGGFISSTLQACRYSWHVPLRCSSTSAAPYHPFQVSEKPNQSPQQQENQYAFLVHSQTSLSCFLWTHFNSAHFQTKPL